MINAVNIAHNLWRTIWPSGGHYFHSELCFNLVLLSAHKAGYFHVGMTGYPRRQRDTIPFLNKNEVLNRLVVNNT